VRFSSALLFASDSSEVGERSVVRRRRVSHVSPSAGQFSLFVCPREDRQRTTQPNKPPDCRANRPTEAPFTHDTLTNLTFFCLLISMKIFTEQFLFTANGEDWQAIRDEIIGSTAFLWLDYDKRLCCWWWIAFQYLILNIDFLQR
jgi:hypothetical protein